jgi:predicted permease
MGAIVTALAPILALILAGFGLRRIGFLPEAAWSGIEKLTYFILFPALLIRTLGGQTLAEAPWAGVFAVVSGTLVIATVALVLWHRLRRTVSGPTFTSVFQGGVRFNTYIALAVAQGFFGPEGLVMGALAAGFLIVLINLLCVSALAVWGSAGQTAVRPIVRQIVTNPLILSCLIGWSLSLTHTALPDIADDLLEIIGRAALPLGLLAVGAALKPEAMRGHVQPIAAATVIQFGLKPITAAALIAVSGLQGAAAAAVFIAFITPTAPSAYILARQLGGDTETMASIITFQTLLAFLAMPLWALMLPG